MINYIVSVLIIFCACTIGATVGFGGGIIIKPVLDALNFCTIDAVNFISSCAVLAMSISSLIRHKKQKTKFDKSIALPLSIGAMLGGIIGNKVFAGLLGAVSNDRAKMIQGILIIGFVAFGVVYVNLKKPKTFNFKNPATILLLGLVLGSLNSFLGIGGGPINITFLLLLFSLSVKDGAVYSICVVFFCQMSNLVSLFVSNQFAPYKEQFPIAILGIIAAVIGGLLGSKLNKKFSDKTVKIAFSLVMVFVFGINVYNVIKGII